MRIPEVQLLCWEGCPSTERALAQLLGALNALGCYDAQIRMRQIRSDVDAQRAGFVGSPTILIDGVDPVPIGADAPNGLSCRVYPQRDGTIGPTPDPEDLTEALRRAAALEHAV
jgi:hypothetical protein